MEQKPVGKRLVRHHGIHKCYCGRLASPMVTRYHIRQISMRGRMGVSLPNHSVSRLWNETEVRGRFQNARKVRVEAELDAEIAL